MKCLTCKTEIDGGITIENKAFFCSEDCYDKFQEEIEELK